MEPGSLANTLLLLLRAPESNSKNKVTRGNGDHGDSMARLISLNNVSFAILDITIRVIATKNTQINSVLISS